MGDWEEVKRLAADFQKVQLSSTTQKLSERNCIEIVSWLIERKMIDLVFTRDGKEYLTPAQLVKDILDELYVSGGRVNLVELSKQIGVDLAHINSRLNEVLKSRKDVHSILGQLVDSSYITRIAGEINEKLSQLGQIKVSDLTIQYDLPADFLQQQVLEKNLGKIILGKQDKSDPRVYFTESFIARTKAKIRGALAGLTRPTPIASILSHIDVNEKLFFSLFDQTAVFGSVTSRLTGAQYIPYVYARSQNEWAKSFYRQNSYIKFDALGKIGISDYKTYLKKLLSNEEVHYLSSCVVSKTIFDRVEADIDECIVSKTFLDLQTVIPSVFNETDIQLLLESIMTTQRLQQTITISDYIISKHFMDNLSKSCEDLVKTNAQNSVSSGNYQKYQTELMVPKRLQKLHEEVEEKQDKREERRKKATGGKSGGGTQGRETKTKSTKKANRAKTTLLESDEEVVEKKVELNVVSKKEIKGLVAKTLEDEGIEELMDPLVDYLFPKLNLQGLELAGVIYQSTVADRTTNRRQTHNELQNKLNNLITEVRMFEKGLRLLSPAFQVQLNKYLLKTICTDVVNEILNYVAAEQNSSVTTDKFNNEQRLKFVNDLPAEFKVPLLPLVTSLSAKTTDDFMKCVEDALKACSMILKKIDKKKDKALIASHRQALLDQLNQCDDVALVLHLALLIIFVTGTGHMLHCSGKHVGTLLPFIRQYTSQEQGNELASYYDFLVLMLGGGSEVENAKEKLKEKMATIKNIANDYVHPSEVHIATDAAANK